MRNYMNFNQIMFEKRMIMEQNQFGARPQDMSALSVFCAEKAGISTEVLRRDVQRVVYEMSKNSPHFQNEMEKAQRTTRRIKKMLDKVKRIEAQWKAQPMVRKVALKAAERKRDDIDSSMHDTRRLWIVCDCDAFFASVEIRDDPKLADKPVAVGSKRSVISTANYLARKYGVRSAMPGFIAVQLCKDLHFVKNNFEKYEAAANDMRKIFAEYDADFHCGSLDEAYLDVTRYIRANKQHYIGNDDKYRQETPFILPHLAVEGGLVSCSEQCNDLDFLAAIRIADELRHRIYDKMHLTVSCGIGTNYLIAKIASNINKPFGRFAVPNNPSSIRNFFSGLNVRQLPGVGRVMERELNALQIQTCGDLLKIENLSLVLHVFNESTANWLICACLGISSNRHTTAEESIRKSLGCERTFAELNTWPELQSKLKSIAASLAEDVTSNKTSGRCLTLKLKSINFKVSQRSVTLPTFISTAADIEKHGMQLLHDEYQRLIHMKSIMRLRLMGLKLSMLKESKAENGIEAFLRRKSEIDDSLICISDSSLHSDACLTSVNTNTDDRYNVDRFFDMATTAKLIAS